MLTQIKSLLQSKAAQSAAISREGDGHLKADRMGAAEQAYRRALAADPRNVDACVGLGYVLNHRNERALARESLLTALSVDPENADAHYMLAGIARHDNDVAMAIDYLDRAIALRPGFEFAYRDLFALYAQSGQADRAKEVLDKAAAACPEAADVQNMHGRFLAAQRDFAGAARSFAKASSLAPEAVEYHKNLADALVKNGEPDKAVASYRKAVSFDPGFFDGHLAIADAMLRERKYAEAVVHYRSALALQPRSAMAQANLGVTLQGLGSIDDAIAAYRRAIEIEPRMAAPYANLGSLLMTRAENDEAAACFEKVLEIDPTHSVSHVLAGLKGGDAERAPSAYVAKLFDWYAESFESHLVKGLRYDIPNELRELLRSFASADEAKWDVLDLGCGTGLAGMAVAPFARSLVGVDLSSKMLDKARERALYARLEQLDLITMMRAEASSSYDLVIAADVLVYLGKLDELAIEVQRLLRPGGYFVFSVESLDALPDAAGPIGDARDYRLIDTGRFAHAADYLALLRDRCGFENVSTTDTQIRVHHGEGIAGYLVLWKQSRADGAAVQRQSSGGNI